ncbi:hypothetical protein [Flavobacterium terrisoli]|uniref:hypothetical protein n=1 Tax=Flavobacterium terrisoli TaxID=3242195 RepID=UPI0025438404|nr:hypothetical protein [Flavobacterium buctense]
MKKQLFAALVILTSYAAIAQETPKTNESKLEFSATGKLGFARLKQTGNVPLNGNLTGSDVLLSYQISPKCDISTGLGLYEFNANTTINGANASLKNSYLHIPVQFSGDFGLFKNVKPENQTVFFTLGIGLYANTLLKQKLETPTGNNEEKNMGWNFGISSQIGAKFLLTDVLKIGIGIESQSDLTKMEKDGVKQKIEQYNGMYFKLGFKF